MTTLANLDRNALEELARLYRVSEIGVLTAAANVARRKANDAKRRMQEVSQRTRELASTASQIGKRDGFRGEAYAQAHSAAHAMRGHSQTAERVYIRAEKAAQAAERALKRAQGGRT